MDIIKKIIIIVKLVATNLVNPKKPKRRLIKTTINSYKNRYNITNVSRSNDRIISIKKMLL